MPHKLTTHGGVTQRASQCVRDGNWSAILVNGETGEVPVVHVSYASPKHTMEQQKFETAVTKVPVGEKIQTTEPPLLALQQAPPVSGVPVAYLYILQAGLLSGHKITANGSNSVAAPRSTVSTPPMRLNLPLTIYEQVTVMETCHQCIYIGTAQGRIFRIQSRAATNTLQLQDVSAGEEEKEKSSRGILGLFTPSKKTLRASWNFPHIHAIAPMASTDSFWTVSDASELHLWQADTTTQAARNTIKLDFVLSRPFPRKYLPKGFQITQVSQANDHTLHVLGTARHTEEEGVRWYAVRWQLRSDSNADEQEMWRVVAVTWLNRLSTSAVCQGWQAAQNGTVLGAFLPHQEGPSIVLAVVPKVSHHDEDSIAVDGVYEYDCDPEDDLLPGSFQADYTTHGVTFGYRSGVWVRAQVKVDTAASASPRASISSGDQRLQSATLLSHLKSTLATYIRTTSTTVELPPSWQTPEAATVRDEVVVKLGFEHLPPSASNLHHDYIYFLQQVGLYRSLRPLTKWHLLGMGQQISAYQALVQRNVLQNSFLEGTDLAGWIASKSRKDTADPSELAEWTKSLAACLDAAVRFRSERATFPYDLGSVPPVVQTRQEVPLWLSKPLLQHALQSFVEYHCKLQQREQSGFACKKELKTVLLAALDSFAASFQALPTDRQVRAEYAEMQAMVTQLLIQEDPQLAWDLAQEHNYFEGLCQLARKFESESESDSFALEPLFKVLGNKEDVRTGLAFGRFVLKWHVDNGLYGHALDYGKHCPRELKQLVETDPTFGQFRWIVAVRNGNLEEAAQSLIDNTVKETTTVGQAKINMSFAKIANSLVTEHDFESVRGASEVRRRTIEKLRERANAQEELYGETIESRGKPLRQPNELLNYALGQLDTKDTVSDRVQTCFRALAVCNTFDSTQEALAGATRVWFGALQTDLRVIRPFVLEANQIDVPAILERTALGNLFAEVHDDPDFASVKLKPDVCEGILNKLGTEDRAGVSRLLRSLIAS
eukprot:scaffold32070_cov203-Amphora_coffeaeformis.AAC.3